MMPADTLRAPSEEQQKIQAELIRLGVAIACDLADELDSSWYDFVCNSGMPDEQFLKELAARIEGIPGFQFWGRFCVPEGRQAP